MAQKFIFKKKFNFFPLFGHQWTWKPVKPTQHIKIPSCGHYKHHNWLLGTDFRLENGHIQPLQWPEKSKIFKFLPFSGNQWTWKPLKMTKHIRIPSIGQNKHHNWSLGRDFRFESGHFQPLELFEKWIFWHLTTSLRSTVAPKVLDHCQILCTVGKVRFQTFIWYILVNSRLKTLPAAPSQK